MKQTVLIVLLLVQFSGLIYLIATGDKSVVRYVVGIAPLVMMVNLLPDKRSKNN